MNIALVLAGGIGSRIGSNVPKQYIEVGGKPIISYCLDTFIMHEKVDAIWIVADEMWHSYILEHVRTEKFQGFSIPGDNRQMSIWHGLCDIKASMEEDEGLVIIHDAVRPLLCSKQIDDCITGMIDFDGVMPVLPMKDTVYLSQDGKTVSKLLDRSRIFAGQAPEVFRLNKYYEANKKLFPEKILQINGSTEPAILMGMDILMIPGDEQNFKITTKEDLSRFREMIGSL